MTVSATAKLRLATTPLMAMAAVPRMRRARSMASIGKSRRASSGARRSYNSAIRPGKAVMLPTSSSPTDTYAAIGMPNKGGTYASAAPSTTSEAATQ